MNHSGRRRKTFHYLVMGLSLLVLGACGGPPSPDPGGPVVPGIHGTVVDQNGAPVAGAMVEVRPVGMTPHIEPALQAQNHRKLIDETNAQGEFAIAIETEGDYTVIVTKGNMGAAETEIRIEEDAEGNLETVEVTLTATPLGHLEGDVILQGLPDNLGADIFIPGTSLSARSEADGEWVLDHVPAGGWELVIHYPGFSRFETWVEVQAGEVTFVEDVSLQPVAPLTIAPFSASPNSLNVPEATTFSWQVDNPEGGALSCSLDVNGDAIPDYTLENCREGSQTHSYPQPGTYLATLRMSSPLQQAQASTTVVVGEQGEPPPPPPDNQAPTAVAGENTEVDVGTPALLDGSHNQDPDGDQLTFSWTLAAPDGSDASALIDDPEAVRTRFVPPTIGTYTATLKVSDGELSSSDTKVITAVEPAPNQPPEAAFTVTPEAGFPPLAIQADASASNDPDGEIVAYQWDFGDGNTAEGVTVEHTYEEAGTYTLILKVEDGEGATASAEQEVVAGRYEQTTTLLNSHPAARRRGPIVAVDGTVALAGLPEANSSSDYYSNPYSGVVDVYERQQDGTWEAVGTITPPSPRAMDFGRGVALKGGYGAIETAIAEGPDSDPTQAVGFAVYVFQRDDAGNWLEHELLTAADFGASDLCQVGPISMGGTTLAIQACLRYEDGHRESPIAVFEKDQGGPDNWGLVKIVRPQDYGIPFFGWGLNLSDDGNSMIVGHSGSDDGHVRGPSAHIFERHQGGTNAWGLAATLRPPGGAPGEYSDYNTYGWTVDIEENIAVVGTLPMIGAIRADVFVYERDSGDGDWIERVRHAIYSTQEGLPYMGYQNSFTNVTVEGDIVAAGAYVGDCALEPSAPEDMTCDPGRVYIFARNQGGPDAWGLAQLLEPSDPEATPHFGITVDLSTSTMVVGGHRATGDDEVESIFIFEK